MAAPKRYKAPALRWYDYADHFWVTCPHCNSLAIVSVPMGLYIQKASAKCMQCHWKTDYSSRIYFEPTPGAVCTQCRTSLPHSFILLPHPNHHTILICETCGSEHKVVRWTKKLKKFNQKGILDPIFGIELYFKSAIGKDTLWVINEKHLEALLGYVSADLREKPRSTWHMSMVEKLPKFIIQKRNRQKITSLLNAWKQEINPWL